MEFSLDDRLIASFWGTAKLFDASNLSLIWEDAGVWPSVAFHLVENRLVFSNWLGTVLDMNIEDLGNISATEHKLDFKVNGLVFSPSGNTCVTDTSQGAKILYGDTFIGKSSFPYPPCTVM